MNDYPGSRLHQVGPYIGKMRPALARRLVSDYSSEGDWVWDPFCGCGTIPLECMLLSRHVIAADVNPYACALTRAKLHLPRTEATCLSQLQLAARVLDNLHEAPLRDVPEWVSSFFHEQTFREACALMAEFTRRRMYFHIGCLLAILHHQRPGFLSYPASHLVPYLRDKLYPRHEYPEAYEYRDPIPRLAAKARRALKNPPPPLHSRFRVLQRSALTQYLPSNSIDAVITSPPYMDALDYARDNRLRLWMLGVDDYKAIRRKEIRKVNAFEQDMLGTLQVISQVLKPGGKCVFVLGDVRRSGPPTDTAQVVMEIALREMDGFDCLGMVHDSIPDVRRARKAGRSTKKESIVILERCR